jgi:HPt (histidine-containing phosphotransfer) domain-containing protein
LEADLHFLKGSALNLGFRHLAALCGAGEKRAAVGAAVDVAEVAESFAASRQAFVAGLGGSRAA